jgi:hypothetical protein
MLLAKLMELPEKRYQPRVDTVNLPENGYLQKKEEEINRLPWLGQSGRAAAGCACTAAALRC